MKKHLIYVNIEKDLSHFFWFLSDPSPIIGYACQWLTPSCLENLIDVREAVIYVLADFAC